MSVAAHGNAANPSRAGVPPAGLPFPGREDAAAPAALAVECLQLTAFRQLAGMLGGLAFVRLVVERENDRVHFINEAEYTFHADYIAERIMGIPRSELRARIDSFNKLVYLSPERSYLLGILALHPSDAGPFFTVETGEIDNMDDAMLLQLYTAVKGHVDPALPLFFKPANHEQERRMAGIDAGKMPRLFSHELYASRDFVALNPGKAQGRLRLLDEANYKAELPTIRWYDILVMDRVPDDIPRVSGLINARHTTPLSHTNVLACGWAIPNAVQVGIAAAPATQHLNGKWVTYEVDPKAAGVLLTAAPTPEPLPDRPSWSLHQVRLEEPETVARNVALLADLRASDSRGYGTKAANLGELQHLLLHGSPRLTGYYRVPRPPRANLLPYLATFLGAAPGSNLNEQALTWLRANVQIPRGVAVSFGVQRAFLQSSWQIQQSIGKLKMALELNAKEVEPLCLQLQQLIRNTRISDEIRDLIDAQITEQLAGVRTFVVRSSSNAEDLQDFSAAGIYESINHVTTAEKLFCSLKEVWASLVSPRSVRLRQEVGISLDDCYMGVIIQEEVTSDLGGVLVTTNPMNPQGDFRNVYINASTKSATAVVAGKALPYQYLYNTVEGGGRTLSLGDASADLGDSQKATLQKLAFAGRLISVHFSQDYTFSLPADIEWAIRGDQIYILQLRPYAI